MENTKKYVAYYRLSTRKQKGLGLDAQRVIVDHYTKQDGAELVQEFMEIESGKETMNRPELLKAMRLCPGGRSHPDCGQTGQAFEKRRGDFQNQATVERLLGLLRLALNR